MMLNTFLVSPQQQRVPQHETQYVNSMVRQVLIAYTEDVHFALVNHVVFVKTETKKASSGGLEQTIVRDI